MEEDKGEYEDSAHHAEGGRVVGIGGGNEPLVLVVAERMDGHLHALLHPAQPKPGIVDLNIYTGVYKVPYNLIFFFKTFI